MKPIKYKRAFLITLIPISFLITQIIKHNNNLAEFYSTEIYPLFAEGIGLITGFVPFSLGEIIFISGILFLTAYTIFATANSIRLRTFKYIKSYLLNMAVFISCIYFLFVLLCGLNYYRYEFTYYSGLEIKESSSEELKELCEDLVNRANELKSRLNTDENGIAVLYDSKIYDTAVKAQLSFDKLSTKYEILKGKYPRPKPVFFSAAMSQTQITGVFFPFTMESNVNVDIPKYEIPAVMCHELVHLRGFMREDEANFLSYMSCINSGYDDFAYSGVMLALAYSMNALYSEDYEAFVKLNSSFSEEVLKDLRYADNYWKQFETKIAEISSNVNDTYLKANNQRDGVKSYGRMVDLLLAEQRHRNK